MAHPIDLGHEEKKLEDLLDEKVNIKDYIHVETEINFSQLSNKTDVKL
jgi:hypothetical protein